MQEHDECYDACMNKLLHCTYTNPFFQFFTFFLLYVLDVRRKQSYIRSIAGTEKYKDYLIYFIIKVKNTKNNSYII